MEFDKINAGRYLAKVRSRINFSKYSAQKNPTVVILGGQPAAGKTSVIEDIQKRFGGNIISINGDDFREVIPVYNKLKKRNPELAVKLSQPYTNYIVDNLLREASDKKLNIIVEGTMKNSGVPLNTASTLKLKGYKIEGIVLTTHELQSRSGLMLRYESELKSKGYGRAVSLESHNEAYNNIPETVRALENSEIFDKISLYNRNTELLAFKESGSISDLADIYEKKREQLSEKDFAALSSQIEWVIARRLERNASEKEIEAARQLRDDLKNTEKKGSRSDSGNSDWKQAVKEAKTVDDIEYIFKKLTLI